MHCPKNLDAWLFPTSSLWALARNHLFVVSIFSTSAEDLFAPGNEHLHFPHSFHVLLDCFSGRQIICPHLAVSQTVAASKIWWSEVKLPLTRKSDFLWTQTHLQFSLWYSLFFLFGWFLRQGFMLSRQASESLFSQGWPWTPSLFS